jgi:cell division inhibitor SepF
MAGAMRKMAVYLGLVEDDDRYDDYDDYDDMRRDDRREDQVAAAGRSAALHDDHRALQEDHRASVSALPDHRSGDRRPLTTATVQSVVSEPYRITTLHPRNYNEARTIGEHFRDGTPVIMNLTEMDDTDAKRLVDFAAGLVFGLHGSIERVTQKVFLLSPANVDVTAEDKARIAEGGFFNQS